MAENHIHAELKSKYDEALSKYNCNISDAEVAEAVKKIIAEKVPQNDTEACRRLSRGSAV